jgi:hypothetical protein
LIGAPIPFKYLTTGESCLPKILLYLIAIDKTVSALLVKAPISAPLSIKNTKTYS